MTTSSRTRSTASGLTDPPAAFVAGLVLWAAAMVALPAPLAGRILLLAPLVVVPRLLTLLPERHWIGRLEGWPALLAALPLIAAYALPPGAVAAVFSLPWLAVALAAAAAALVHGLANLPRILHPRELPSLGVDVALAFWAVGAAFTTIDRLGLDIGFSAVIVLLTATHFHFAGFGLLGVASLLAAHRTWLRAPVLGLIVGIPVTALGFVTASDVIGAIGAVLVGTSAVGVAVALLTTPSATTAAPLVTRLAGLALLVGAPMGIAWSLAILLGQGFLDLDTMIRSHGVLNATAVLVAVATLRE
jgi:hypothetical protein